VHHSNLGSPPRLKHQHHVHYAILQLYPIHYHHRLIHYSLWAIRCLNFPRAVTRQRSFSHAALDRFLFCNNIASLSGCIQLHSALPPMLRFAALSEFTFSPPPTFFPVLILSGPTTPWLMSFLLYEVDSLFLSLFHFSSCSHCLCPPVVLLSSAAVRLCLALILHLVQPIPTMYCKNLSPTLASSD